MSFMQQEIEEQPATLEKSLKTNHKLIDDIANMIQEQDIRFVFIAARGTSDHAGIYGKYVFEYLLGIPVVLAAPSIVTVYQKKLHLENSLVIGISQSGEALDVLDMIKEANDQGTVTIGITNFENSPLAKASKFHLFLNTGVEKSVAATKTFTAQIYLLSWLAAQWADNNQLKRELDLVPSEINNLLKNKNEVKVCAENYITMHDCFVLSRGINYSIALEAALKIQETANIHAIAQATSDFYHGPIAMVNEYDPILLFASSGPCFKDIAAMNMKLKEKNVSVIAVSNRPELSDFCDYMLNIPSTSNDIVSPFYNVTVAQVFACQLSLSKGLNPDLPRGLKKVIVTK